jgi:hypothetical protein
MNEIQDVKAAFGNSEWEKRVAANPRRIYGFLLASDEHKAFLTFIQDAWRTLHAMSGDACDIFTFEQWHMPHERFESQNYVSIPSPSLGGGRIMNTDRLPEVERKLRGSGGADQEALKMVRWLSNYPGQSVAIDNGIRIPDRFLCYELKDKLFNVPESIVLPGLALFSSPSTLDATYIYCGGLSPEQLSELFQKVLNLVRSVYRGHLAGDRFDVYEAVMRAYQRDRLKGKVIKAVSTLTIKDIVSILTSGIHLVTPKSGSSPKNE